MESILLLAHTEADGALAKPALEALTAALALDGELTVGLVGGSVESAANLAAAAGARRILAGGAKYPVRAPTLPATME